MKNITWANQRKKWILGIVCTLVVASSSYWWMDDFAGAAAYEKKSAFHGQKVEKGQMIKAVEPKQADLQSPFNEKLEVVDEMIHVPNQFAKNNDKAVTAKVESKLPMLKGIVGSEQNYIAILEENQKSGQYGVGEKIGDYTIVEIHSTSVTLAGPQGRFDLKL